MSDFINFIILNFFPPVGGNKAQNNLRNLAKIQLSDDPCPM